MTRRPLDGYPALQYLQSGRVRKLSRHWQGLYKPPYYLEWDDFHEQSALSHSDIVRALVVEGFPFDRLEYGATLEIDVRADSLLKDWATWRILSMRSSEYVVEPRLIALVEEFKGFTQEEKIKIRQRLNNFMSDAQFESMLRAGNGREAWEHKELSRYVSKIEDVLMQLRRCNHRSYCLTSEGRWLSNSIGHKFACSEDSSVVESEVEANLAT
jgi:hypothetical protein